MTQLYAWWNLLRDQKYTVQDKSIGNLSCTRIIPQRKQKVKTLQWKILKTWFTSAKAENSNLSSSLAMRNLHDLILKVSQPSCSLHQSVKSHTPVAFAQAAEQKSLGSPRLQGW